MGFLLLCLFHAMLCINHKLGGRADIRTQIFDLIKTFGGPGQARTDCVLLKKQVHFRQWYGPTRKIGAGVEDRTPLIFFVGEAPSPDDNPGIHTTWWTEGRSNPRLLGFNQALHRLSYQSEIGGEPGSRTPT